MANLTRYDLCTQDDDGGLCEGYIDSAADGEYVKLDDIKEFLPSASNNISRAEIALSIQKLEAVRDCYLTKNCLPCKRDIDAVLALLRPC